MLDSALFFAGTSVSWLELVAFAFALAGVVLTARVSPWGWPPTMVASALYGWLFFEHRLYGDAALQIFFIAVSIWGWRAWLRPLPTPDDERPSDQIRLSVHSLSRPARLRLSIALGATWLATGTVLSRFTDTDVAWLDAAPTAGSLFAQVLLARRYREAWALWIGVNAIALALFAIKSLWLTAILYALLLALSVLGWRHWQRLASQR
ncbi:MAG: nicotinamide riboside transporter PnuC [Burkholderiaceae bacterium]